MKKVLQDFLTQRSILFMHIIKEEQIWSASWSDEAALLTVRLSVGFAAVLLLFKLMRSLLTLTVNYSILYLMKSLLD